MKKKTVHKSQLSFSRRQFLYLTAGSIGAAASGCIYDPDAQSGPARELPLYIDGGMGIPVFRGPYMQSSATVAGFMLPAGLSALRNLCDHYLNVPARGNLSYMPLAPVVFLLFANMDIHSLDPWDAALGHLHECEVSIWIPAVARVPAGGLWVADHIAWFQPYLFVDNGYAIATGREVYGFNKLPATVTMPSPLGAQMELNVIVPGFEKFGSDVMAQDYDLLSVLPVAGCDLQKTESWTSWEEARAVLVRWLLEEGAGDAPDIATGGKQLFNLQDFELSLVFLKQFRDVMDSQRACYQAIVEAPARVQQFRGGGTLADLYQVKINTLASHPLVKLLGLPVDSTGQLVALASLWLDMDFTLEHGVEVWKTEI